MAQEVVRRRFTVHRMGEAGILHEDDRVELIEGEIAEMAAIGTRVPRGPPGGAAKWRE